MLALDFLEWVYKIFEFLKIKLLSIGNRQMLLIHTVVYHILECLLKIGADYFKSFFSYLIETKTLGSVIYQKSNCRPLCVFSLHTTALVVYCMDIHFR